MIKSLNRPEIAKRFAKDFNLTYKQTEAILEETEKSIFNFLKERDQVRIHGFGTFYIATFKSHVIKQIRTKTPRIILEQKGIKFRPSPIFKDAIYQRVRKPQTPKAAELEQERTIEIKPIRATPKQPTPEAKPAEIRKPLVEFKPINIHCGTGTEQPILNLVFLDKAKDENCWPEKLISFDTNKGDSTVIGHTTRWYAPWVHAPHKAKHEESLSVYRALWRDK